MDYNCNFISIFYNNIIHSNIFIITRKCEYISRNNNKSNIYIDPISSEIYYIIDNNPILSFEEYSKCDVWILNIDGVFHNIVGRYEDSIFKTFINSDYNFTFDTEKVIYYVGNNISRIDINIDFSVEK
jgi:hypothetical protein